MAITETAFVRVVPMSEETKKKTMAAIAGTAVLLGGVYLLYKHTTNKQKKNTGAISTATVRDREKITGEKLALGPYSYNLRRWGHSCHFVPGYGVVAFGGFGADRNDDGKKGPDGRVSTIAHMDIGMLHFVMFS